MVLYRQVIKEVKGKTHRLYTPVTDQELIEECIRKGLITITGEEDDGRVLSETGEETR